MGAQPLGLCKKHYKAQWYQQNRERALAEQKLRRQQEPDTFKERNRSYYQRNRERMLAYEAAKYQTDPDYVQRKKAAALKRRVEKADEVKAQKAAAYRAADPEVEAAKRAAYYAAHRAEWREHGRRWRELNPERASLISRNGKGRRRARELGGSVTKADLSAILAEYGMHCHICDSDIESRADLHFDHVVPLARGGAHSPENLRPAHAKCNQSKGARLIA